MPLPNWAALRRIFSELKVLKVFIYLVYGVHAGPKWRRLSARWPTLCFLFSKSSAGYLLRPVLVCIIVNVEHRQRGGLAGHGPR